MLDKNESEAAFDFRDDYGLCVYELGHALHSGACSVVDIASEGDDETGDGATAVSYSPENTGTGEPIQPPMALENTMAGIGYILTADPGFIFDAGELLTAEGLVLGLNGVAASGKAPHDLSNLLGMLSGGVTGPELGEAWRVVLLTANWLKACGALNFLFAEMRATPLDEPVVRIDRRRWDAAVGDIPDGIRSIARKPGQFVTVEGARAALNTVQAISAPDLSSVVVTLESHARRAAEAAFGVDLAGVPIEVNLK